MTTKTKILISILAVGIILIAGFLIWNNYFRPIPISGTPFLPQIPISKVTITTDKTEYEFGEIVEIRIENNLEKFIFLDGCNPKPYGCNPYTIEKKIKNEWTLYKIGCFMEGVSKVINSNKIEKFKLSVFQNDEQAGNFRLKIDYSINCDYNLQGKEKIEYLKQLSGNIFTIFSNEFTIKSF